MTDTYLAMYDTKEKEYGLPEGFLNRTAKLESSHDPNAENPRSTAKGLFQFIDSTAKQYNVDPFDPESATDGAARLASDNKKVLEERLGREVTPGELYLSHQQGGTGAYKLLRNPNALAKDVVGLDAVVNNGGKEDMTAGEFASLWTGKYDIKNKLIERQKQDDAELGALPQKVKRGELTLERATKMAEQLKMSRNVLMLDPADAEYLWEQGVLTDGQADMYLDYRESPVWFRTKDIVSSVPRGILEGIDGMVNAMAEFLMPSEIADNIKSPLHKMMPESKLMTGDIVREISQFMVPYSAATKTVKVAGVVQKIMSVPKLAALQKTSPIIYKGVEGLIHGTLAGAPADYSTFKPADPVITNMLDHYGILPEYLEFLMTDPNDPAPLNRLRRVIDGAAMGSVAELIFAGVRGVKASMMKKHSGDVEAIAKELRMKTDDYKVLKAFDDIFERDVADVANIEAKAAAETPGVKPNEIDNLGKAVDETSPTGAGTKQEVDEIVPPRRSEEVVSEADGTTKVVESSPGQKSSPVDGIKSNRDEQARRIVNTMSNDSTPVFHEDLIARMKKDGLDTAEKLLKVVYRESHELMEKVRKSQGHQETEQKAMAILQNEAIKKNADLTGVPMDYARRVWGKMKNATEMVHALNEFYTAYAKQLDTFIDEVVTSGDFVKKLEAMEHIKMFQELQSITYGVRAESGRLLNIYRKKYGSSRFDLSKYKTTAEKARAEFDLKTLKEASEAEIDAALKAFKDATKLKDKMEKTRKIGRLRTLRGLLEYVQLDLLWSPATHVKNVLSQCVMVGWKTMHRTAGGVIQFGLSGGQMKHLADVGMWYAGMLRGLQDAFHNPVKGIVEGSKTLYKELMPEMFVPEKLLKDNMVSFEKLLANPEIGLFYRTMVTGQPLMEALVKEGIPTSADSPLRAFIEKVPVFGKPMSFIFRSPFNALAGVDDVFKSIGYNGEAYSRMYREGTELGLGKAEMKKWMSNIENEKELTSKFLSGADDDEMRKLVERIGTDRMPLNVIEESRYTMRDFTFQHPTQGAARDFEGFLNNNPIGLAIRITAMPFYRIMINMLKWMKNNTAAGIFGERFKHEWSQGGVVMWESLSRVATGTSILAGSAYLAGLGFVTGEVSKEMRQAHDGANIPPNSFWSGSKWVSLQGLEPISTIVQIGANLRTAFNRAEAYHNGADEVELWDVVGGAVMAFADPLFNQTFMQGMKDLTTLINDYDRLNMSQWTQKQMQKFFPSSTMFNFIQKNLGDDEYVRTYGKNWEGFKSVMEVVNRHIDTKKMYLKRHAVYGTPVKKEDPILLVYNTREPSGDEVAYEMLRIGCNILPPRNTYTNNNLTYNMTNDEFDRYQEILSQFPIRDILQSVIDSEGYQAIGDDETKSNILKKIVSNIRRSAQGVWASESGTVIPEMIRKAEKKAKAIAGIEGGQNVNSLIYNYQELLSD